MALLRRQPSDDLSSAAGGTAEGPFGGEESRAVPPVGDGVRRSAQQLVEQIDAILAEAEQVANEIQQDAEARARRYIDESRREAEEMRDRLSTAAESFAERWRAAQASLRDGATAIERLSSALGEEAQKVLAQVRELELAGDQVLAAQPRVEAPPRIEPETPRPPAAASPAPEIRSEGALLRAAQMAIQGRTRDEIEASLRSEFGTDEATAIVDEILRPG